MQDTFSRRTGHHEMFDTVHRLIVHLNDNCIVSKASCRHASFRLHLGRRALVGPGGIQISCAYRPKFITNSLQVLLEEILIVTIAAGTETNL